MLWRRPGCGPQPVYRLVPSGGRRPSVSRFGSLERFGIGLQHTTHPVRVVGELGKSFNGEWGVCAIFITDAVPAEDDGLEQGQITFLAELGKLLAAQALEGDVEGAGIEGAAV